MYKIVIDSCGELPEELKQDGHYETVKEWYDGYRFGNVDAYVPGM